MEIQASVVSDLKSKHLAKIESAKSAIVELTKNNKFLEISRHSVSAQGSQEALKHIEKIESILDNNKDNPMKALHVVISYIEDFSMQGVQDTWSGRENDMMRSIHDDVMNAMGIIRDMIRFSPDYQEFLNKAFG